MGGSQTEGRLAPDVELTCDASQKSAQERGECGELGSRAVLRVEEISLEQLDLADTLVVKSSCGTGKTQTMVEYIEEKQLRVLYVCYRVSLVDNMVKRFAYFKAYTDCYKHLDDNQSVACTAESLYKFVQHKWDAVVFDEIESVVTQLTSPLHKAALQTKKALAHLMGSTKKVFGLDATAGYLTHYFLERYRRQGSLWIVCKPKPKQLPVRMYKASQQQYLSDVKKYIDEHPRHRIVFPTNSKKVAIAIKAMLRAGTFLYYDGDTLGDAQVKRRNAEDDNQERDGKRDSAHDHTVVDESLWKDAQYIVYTPTVEAGVSHTESEFDRCMAYYCTKSNAAIGCYQMLFRCRSLKTIDIYSPSKRHYVSCLPDTSIIKEKVAGIWKSARYDLCSI